jgi:hypothetical protein
MWANGVDGQMARMHGFHSHVAEPIGIDPDLHSVWADWANGEMVEMNSFP